MFPRSDTAKWMGCAKYPSIRVKLRFPHLPHGSPAPRCVIASIIFAFSGSVMAEREFTTSKQASAVLLRPLCNRLYGPLAGYQRLRFRRRVEQVAHDRCEVVAVNSERFLNFFLSHFVPHSIPIEEGPQCHLYTTPSFIAESVKPVRLGLPYKQRPDEGSGSTPPLSAKT